MLSVVDQRPAVVTSEMNSHGMVMRNMSCWALLAVFKRIGIVGVAPTQT